MQMLKYVNDGYEYSCHLNPLKSELITKQANWDEIVVSLFFPISINIMLYFYISRTVLCKNKTQTSHIYVYINNICKKESLTGQKWHLRHIFMCCIIPFNLKLSIEKTCLPPCSYLFCFFFTWIPSHWHKHHDNFPLLRCFQKSHWVILELLRIKASTWQWWLSGVIVIIPIFFLNIFIIFLSEGENM